MQLFYSKNIKDKNDLISLVNQENIHLVKVLRKNIGDTIFVTNGKGLLFKAEIESTGKKKSTIKIIEIINKDNLVQHLSIAIAPTKVITRIEFFIEKCVEIGVKDFYFFSSYHSERRKINQERLQLKSLSAMKQSLKFCLPLVNNIAPFKKLLENISLKFELKFIAYCEENTKMFVSEIDKNKDTILLIGPEGGFTKEEVDLAKQFGFISVSLGTSRLRTETAGIYACSVFNALS